MEQTCNCTQLNNTRNSEQPKTEKRNPIKLSPLIDIVQTDSGILVTAELPGTKSELIDIELRNDVLSISAPALELSPFITADQTPESAAVYHRALRLGSGFDEEQIKAEYRLGVLSIEIQYRRRPASRKVQVH